MEDVPPVGFTHNPMGGLFLWIRCLIRFLKKEKDVSDKDKAHIMQLIDDPETTTEPALWRRRLEM